MLPRAAPALEFCAEDPIERVYLEEAAQRGPGRQAVERLEEWVRDPVYP